MLSTYQTRVQRFLLDAGAQFTSVAAVNDYINEARGWVAAEGQCVKVLTPGTNGIASISVTAGGSGYTAATATITGPGTGATATVTVVAGAVTAVNVTAAGTKYDNTTTVTISGDGTGATATPVINCLNTVNGQEIYTFAAANPVVQLTSGVSSIIFVQSIAVSWGALKPTLNQWNWDDLQAKVRSYPVISGQPSMWAQLAQGGGGSVFIQPVPTSALPMEWNCVCKPIDLVDDTTPEAIPYPWTDAVPYYAAYIAFMGMRRPEEAKNMLALYDHKMQQARAFSESVFIPSFYD